MHVVFALFVVLGGLLVMRWHWLLWFHVLAVLWACATLSLDLGCPLTIWEKSCSRRAGVEPYQEGFVAHYLGRVNLSPRASQVFHIALGAGAVLLNVLIYGYARF